MTPPAKDDLEERLAALRGKGPRPREAARASALSMAMQSFDASAAEDRQKTVSEKNLAGTKGMGLGQRLMSIVTVFRRIFDMDMRIAAPVTALVVGAILMPFAWQLTQNTALTPPTVTRQVDLVPADQAGRQETAETEIDIAALPAETERRRAAQFGDAETAANPPAAQKPLPQLTQESPLTEAAPAADLLAGNTLASGARQGRAPAKAIAGRPISSLESQAGDRFEAFADNGVSRTADNPVSTFSIDVDTASYAYVRRALEDGQLPPADAVRVEELINYFDYDYAAPGDPSRPFAPTLAIYPSPWADGKQILHIGIKGFPQSGAETEPANLVFLIDTSGSMNSPDKLPLLKRSFQLLLDQLNPEDTVSIVTYAGSAGTVLEPTKAAERAKILHAIETLTPGGSTAGAAGLEEAYRLAALAKVDRGTNRVILATDGDFNVGLSGPQELKRFIAEKRDEGVSLSVLGFGSGTYHDALMDDVTDSGKGAYVYVDSRDEAERQFGDPDRFVANMAVAARNVRTRVTLPWYFGVKVFHGEEYSESKEEVAPQHLAPNDAMNFHQILEACDPSEIQGNDRIRVHLEWSTPPTATSGRPTTRSGSRSSPTRRPISCTRRTWWSGTPRPSSSSATRGPRATRTSRSRSRRTWSSGWVSRRAARETPRSPRCGPS